MTVMSIVTLVVTTTTPRCRSGHRHVHQKHFIRRCYNLCLVRKSSHLRHQHDFLEQSFQSRFELDKGSPPKVQRHGHAFNGKRHPCQDHAQQQPYIGFRCQNVTSAVVTGIVRRIQEVEPMFLEFALSFQQQQVQESPNGDAEGPSPCLDKTQRQQGTQTLDGDACPQHELIDKEPLDDPCEFQDDHLASKKPTPPRHRGMARQKGPLRIAKSVVKRQSRQEKGNGESHNKRMTTQMIHQSFQER
mmetsp:Transcript_2732/g.4689  ORF Transcript_2732/g.4689 Transcript_2732/m.4689 type:complete len:245 (+) Transcript_2732:283-1017(+)